MIDSKVIDTAIGVVLMILFLSLICTAVTEGLSRIFSLRSEFLKKGIQQLISDPTVAGNIMAHPLLTGLQEPNTRLWFLNIWDRLRGGGPPSKPMQAGHAQDMPSYISPSLFRAATVENLLHSAQLNLLRETAGNALTDPATQAVINTAIAGINAAPAAITSLTGVVNELPNRDVKKYLDDRLAEVGKGAKTAQEAIKEIDAYTASLSEGDLKHKLEDILRTGRDDLSQLPGIVRSIKTSATGLGGAAPSEALTSLAENLQTLSAMGAGSADRILAAVDAMPEGKLSQSLRAILQDVGEEASKIDEAIEAWFDNQMNRVTGWYKRHVRWIVIGIAVLFATLFNADTIRVGLTLWQDETIRAEMIALAGNAAPPATVVNTTSGGSGNPGVGQPTPAGFPTKSEDQQALLENLRSGISRVQLLGWRALDDVKLPWLGVTIIPGQERIKDSAGKEITVRDPREFPRDFGDWATKIIGLAVTVIALQQSSNFWFDLLKKLVNMRSSGPQPAAPAATQGGSRPG